MRLLVTGFGPFPRMPRNPSAALALAIAANPRLHRLGIDAQAFILTTAYGTLERELDPLLAQQPDVLIMIGVAGRSRHVRLETRATPHRSILYPDLRGDVPRQVMTGERTRVTRVKVSGAMRALQWRGLAVKTSRDAGRYLCNAAYFRALRRIKPTLFVHIPLPPPLGRRKAAASPIRADWFKEMTAGLVQIAISLGVQARRAVVAPELSR